MKKTVLMIGTFDTKPLEFAFLRQELLRHDLNVLSLNAGTMPGEVPFPVDFDAEAVAALGGSTLEALRRNRDRGAAVTVMCAGASAAAQRLSAEGKIDGLIGMGGGGGTSIATAAMSAIPIGVPKLCISTLASGNTRPFIGGKDILLFPSIVDISGLNPFSRRILSNAAAALAGMVVNTPPEMSAQKQTVLVSMFGNSTAGGNACVRLLEEAGFDTMVFHAVGTGGESLEELVRGGYASAVLDLTTTEWADELCGGIFPAGPSRLDAPGEMGIPHLIVPGCIDMVNFEGSDTVPPVYRDRKLFHWSPQATLMRTTPEENAALGRIFAKKANRAPKTTAFLIPLGGFSELGRQGGAFCDPAADQAFCQALAADLSPEIPLQTSPLNINDPAFAQQAVALLLEMLQHNTEKG